MTDIWNPSVGLAPNLVPNPPGSIPEAPGAGNAVAGLSPFLEALDVEAIIRNLILDRPLKLFVPDREKYPEWDFRIVNSIPGEIAQAKNRGFQIVTNPELTSLFTDLVAGTDKEGKAFRPVLMARPRAVSKHIQKQNRRQLASLYAGMDPRNKQFDSKFAIKVDQKDGTFGDFSGAGWRIKV